MNEYRWSDLHIGMQHEFTTVLTTEDATDFARISGDVNPLHVDDEYARKAGFSSSVLFGMLTSSLYSQLVGVYLPGKFALLHGMDLNFSSPVYAGERLTVSGEVAFMSDAFQRFEIKATIRKDDRKLVSKALIRVGFHAD